MPPPLPAFWIADCASASQFDEVLEAIDCVGPMLDSSPAVLAVPWLVGVEEDDEVAEDDGAAEDDGVVWDKLVRFAQGVVKTEDTAMTATALNKAVAPIRIVGEYR
jgi:hypothetical protein